MEDNKIETPLMKEEEFKEYLKDNMYNEDGSLKLHLWNYEAVNRFKSVRRAIKRGHVSITGQLYPKRPFGNTKSATNIIKRKIYEQLKSRKATV